jgi:hypothetical protein
MTLTAGRYRFAGDPVLVPHGTIGDDAHHIERPKVSVNPLVLTMAMVEQVRLDGCQYQSEEVVDTQIGPPLHMAEDGSFAIETAGLYRISYSAGTFSMFSDAPA